MEDNTPIRWAYPFKSSSVSADGASSDTNNPELYFQALAQAKDGFYPMGASGLWHGGVHFDEGTAGTLEQSSIRCIADGEVIAYRIDKFYPKTLYSRSAGSGSRGVEKDFSTGFVLIKHKLQPPQPPTPAPTSGTPAVAPATTPTLTFYSLYMHLLDWKGYQASGAPQPPLFISEPLYSVKASKATSPLAGLRVREQANSSSTVLAILPKGCRIKLGDADSAHPNWRKLVSILEGCSIPALSGEGERWVYAKETEETGIADIRLVADRANDTEPTLGTPPKGLKIYKEGNASSKVIGLLPVDVKFSLESGNGTYRKLKAITSGQDIPPLTANCAQNVLGYVAFDDLEVADKTIPILDEVHLLDSAIDIKAGELIGHIGRYQNFDDALPRPMLHLQVFTCDALPTFISQCQELAKQLPNEQKTLAMVNVGTKMASPPAADTSVAAERNVRVCNDSPKEGCWAKVQQYVELKAKKAGFGSFDNAHNRYPMDANKKNELASEFGLDVAELPDTVEFLLESYKDDGSDMYPGKNNIPATHTRRKVGVLLKTPLWVEREKLNSAGQRTSTSGEVSGWQNFPLSNSLDGELCGYNRVLPRSAWSSLDQKHKAIAPDNIRWWYVTVADAHGKDISGWVPEQDPILSLHSPWEWPGFSYVEDKQPLDAQLARQLNADGGLRGAEAERYLAQIDAAERGDILSSLYDIIDLPNERNQRDQKLSAEELKTALGRPWLAQQLSLLITHFESEWYWSESKWNALDTLMAPTPDQPNPIWEAEKTRIKALSWWDKLADKHEINTDGKVWHFHPVGLVSIFASDEDLIDVSSFIEAYKSDHLNFATGTPNLSQQSIDNLTNLAKEINSFCKKNNEQLTIYELAYMLATARHESYQWLPASEYFSPKPEYGPISYFNKYDPILANTEELRQIAIDNENTEEGDGYKYRGRGLVHLTWKRNYRLSKELLGFDFVTNPGLAAELKHSVPIMILGMKSGMFTGKKISNYINNNTVDYVEARRVINGTDQRSLIASYAERFESILRLTSSAKERSI